MKKPGIDKNQSLALRLNAKMFWEQLSSFLFLDIILIAVIFCGSIAYMENTASTIADDMADLKQEEISFGNYDVTFRDSTPTDYDINKNLQDLMPENTRSPYRALTWDSGKSGFSAQLKTTEYHIFAPAPAYAEGQEYMDIAMKVGVFYSYAFKCMIIVMIIQIFMLISTVFSTKKAVAKALEPLRELSEATQAFSDAASGPSGQYAPDALKNLARALDAINVSHLDTRIPSELMAEELKPLAAAINEMLNRINESYDSQIRFVSDASHELRTPIAVIQGYADLLSRWGTEDKDTLDESIQAIRTEAESMKQLVNQLLFLARGDTDTMKLDWKPLDLSKIVSEVVKEFDMIDKIHDIKADIAPGIKVEGDQGLIKQLLRILTDNSIKYTPDGGVITVRLVADDMARIVIQDEGVGIPEDVLPHIFDRFVRADESRARHTGGAGLGLSIGKWITEKHNGYLEVLSREGIGTRFTVVLPVIDERPVISE